MLARLNGLRGAETPDLIRGRNDSRLLVRRHRHTAAEQVAVAVDVVNSAYRRPVLRVQAGACPGPRPGEHRRADLAWIGVSPLALEQAGRCVRSVFERVVFLGPFAALDPADLLA